MLFFGGSPTLVRCDFRGNTATVGGALALTGHGEPTVSACTFHDNAAEHGGGLLALTATATLTGCAFWANSADSLGGAAYGSLSTVTLGECTFHGNAAPHGGGALYGELQTDWIADRTILASSPAGEAVLCVGGSTAVFSCSDVWGNAGGDWVGALAGQEGTNGNFSADPQWCDADAFDFRLQSGSPCLPGNHPDGASCGTIGAYGECAAVGADAARFASSPALTVFPNPSRRSVNLAWQLPGGGASRITILDVRGRLLRSFDMDAPAGVIRWDGRAATGQLVTAGVYFVRLEGAARGETRRLLLVR
jgi:predicted outer membrane repeat protein